MAQTVLPPAECPYCGETIQLPLVTAADRRGRLSAHVNDVEWYLHLGVQHPGQATMPPLWTGRKK